MHSCFRPAPCEPRSPRGAPQAAEGGQAALELHRDGSLLSFNVLLSRPDAFAGGGTAFPHLAVGEGGGGGGGRCLEPHGSVADAAGVVHLAQGDAVVHSGSVLHGGRRVTAGRRTLLVGFVDTVRDAGRAHAPAGRPHAHAHATRRRRWVD